MTLRLATRFVLCPARQVLCRRTQLHARLFQLQSRELLANAPGIKVRKIGGHLAAPTLGGELALHGVGPGRGMESAMAMLCQE